ncbi:hypothetical protein BJX99DRAFT_233531 [Aspergillus californicus]
MPSILTDADKETVKRYVPKPANKIHAVAVARLYVAYPDPHRWTYTGLQGALVLANDLVGRTFWLKLVDVSPIGKGVIWDQEIYDNFQYNQDRTFFHTFELDDCPAGLSFADEKEAKTFIKKMIEREKNASKETRQTPFASTRGQGPTLVVNGKSGGVGRSIFGSLLGHRSSSGPTQITPAALPPAPASHVAPPPPLQAVTPPRKELPFDTSDPSWKGLLKELEAMGFTEDQIADNADFIKSYIEQKQTNEAESATPPADDQRKGKAPPPPPPPAPPAPKTSALSPQNTGNSAGSRRGAPPPPPPSRKTPAKPDEVAIPPREPSPPRDRFRAPPPIADAGKFAHTVGPAPPARQRAMSGANPGPPPPPRPPKAPMDDGANRFGVPPPFQGERKVSAPPAPPSRSPLPPGPPPPPPRTASPASPPLLPPKVPSSGFPAPGPPPPPPRSPASQPPPLPPATSRPIPSLPSANVAPPPPPPPPPPAPPFSNVPPPPRPPPATPARPNSNVPPPPPPPPPATSGPPAPPPPPPPAPGGFAPPPPPPPAPPSGGPPPPPAPPGGAAPPLPKPTGGRDDLLASIRASGSGGLRKVHDSDKKDRSAASVPGGTNESSAATPSTGGAPQGGLAGALQDALAKRKQKVSGSDDEKDDDDDW